VKTWLITGVSTVRDAAKVADLTAKHPGTFTAEILDVTDTPAVRDVVDRSFDRVGRTPTCSARSS
jgi:hypothetical protein